MPLDNIASLVRHPETPCAAVDSVVVSGSRGHAGLITLRYQVTGDIARIVIPPDAAPRRGDRLWTTTCFELFTRDPGEENYREYNFSPSGQWAAYSFLAYRQQMTQADIWAPTITTSLNGGALTVDVTFVSPRLGAQHVGASAVIEEKGGAISYWALAHPDGKPDFHHPACFAYQLPAPQIA
jgi:hypothetical protein